MGKEEIIMGFYNSFKMRYLTTKVNKNLKKDKNLQEELQKNSEFKNLHKGQRCFIVGNGPSLKDEDLSTLKEEVVFTVNKIANLPQFNEMKTNYHFWADPAFFALSPDNEEDLELVKTFFAIRTEANNPICFLPSFAGDFIKNFNVKEKLNIRIYSAQLPFLDGENQEIDFTKPTFGYQNVVQFAIAMAIYMGFSEIYLLGCDSTGLISTIQAYLNEEVSEFAYNVSENEKKFLKKMAENREHGIESDFLGWARILHLYGELYRYCSNRNVKLVNCSSKTIVDSIPRESLTDVLKRGNNDK
jgi:hypothetical protein